MHWLYFQSPWAITWVRKEFGNFDMKTELNSVTPTCRWSSSVYRRPKWGAGTSRASCVWVQWLGSTQPCPSPRPQLSLLNPNPSSFPPPLTFQHGKIWTGSNETAWKGSMWYVAKCLCSVWVALCLCSLLSVCVVYGLLCVCVVCRLLSVCVVCGLLCVCVVCR